MFNKLVEGLLVLFFMSHAFAGGVHLSGGKNHHDGHSHLEYEERPTISLTAFQEKSELFLEFPTLVQNQESKFLAHLTYLQNSKPFLEGKVIVILRSPGQPDEIFRADSAARDGIFMPVVIPRFKERRNVTVFVQAAHGTEIFSLGEHQVFASAAEIPKGREEETQHISFLKEQQWKTEFGIQKIQSQHLVQSVQAPAKIVVPNDALRYVKSPLEGLLLEILVDRYQSVQKGQALVRIQPTEEFTNQYYELQTNLEKLNIEIKFQESEVGRFSKLVEQQSASQKELLSSRLQVAKLQVERSAVKRTITILEKSYQLEEKDGLLNLILSAQDQGMILNIHESSGVRLEKLEEIMSILNPDKLLMEIYFPLEGISFKLSDLAYRHVGSEIWHSGKGKFLLEMGQWLHFTDPSQTYHAYSIPLVDGLGFRPAQSLEVEAFSAVRKEGITIPREAISVEQGDEYVYVQVDGENYERRRVQTGRRMANQILILDGVKPGEWVVVKGVYNLRLAGSRAQVPDHGHAH